MHKPINPYKQSDIKWTSNEDKDDFTAIIYCNFIKKNHIESVKYTLRAEDMGGWWWTCLYVENEQTWANCDEPSVRTEKEAKNQVLNAFNNHLKNN